MFVHFCAGERMREIKLHKKQAQNTEMHKADERQKLRKPEK